MNALKTLLMKTLRLIRLLVVDRRAVAIMVTESVGSPGDQAMAEVMREQLVARGFKPTFVYMPGWTPMPLKAEASTVILKSDMNFSPQFLRVLMRHGALVAIGADVVDGTYGTLLPMRWLGKLIRAREVGAKAGLVNFSFSKQAKPIVVERLRNAGNITFTLRDPVSLMRFAEATGQVPTKSADLAFLLAGDIHSSGAKESERWLSARKADGHTVLFANLSGHTLLHTAGDGVAAMCDTLRQWLSVSPDRSVFLVPHDFRPAPLGDVEALEQVLGSLATEYPNRIAMIRPPFAAWEIKALCQNADLAISGRMHLVIACFGMGVPALSIVRVGKFEGLMEHVGLADEDLLITSSEALNADHVAARLERITADRARLSAIIKAKLPDVKALSARNFDWI